MATRAKDSSPGIVKEKRRISYSPSFPRPSNTTRKSVNTTTTTTTIPPDYIKPTKPSNVDPLLKPVSTKASSSTLPKPADLARRRSFGTSRPLSHPKKPAPAANADTTPKTPAATVVRPKPLTQRSRSSSSLKAPERPSAKPKVATTARKPVPGKLSRPATTAVYKKKQPQSNAAPKSVQSTSSSAKRNLPKSSDSTDETDARKSDHEVETESSCQDIHDQESICSSVVDANNEIDNAEMTADMVHDDQVEENDEAYLLSEASTVVSEIEQSEAELENKVNEVTEKLQQENPNSYESRRDADNDDDASSMKDGVESEEEKVTNNDTNCEKAAAEEEEKAVDDKNEKLADKEKLVVEEMSGGDEQVKEENDDMKKKINNKFAGGSNKKEYPAASNDVIEETATKLRVQRKNKVLALVGAFETVMSSQDS